MSLRERFFISIVLMYPWEHTVCNLLTSNVSEARRHVTFISMGWSIPPILSAGDTASAGTPLTRCFNGKDDHMCVTGDCTQCPSGYTCESSLGNMRASGDRTLYRCRDGSDHFDTTDSTCEGQTVEGILGYLSSSCDTMG